MDLWRGVCGLMFEVWELDKGHGGKDCQHVGRAYDVRR